jgi:hypothetical protein
LAHWWFIIGSYPGSGIDPVQLAALFKSQEGGILGMFNMFSGALARFTVFALGIMPYISSIIMQLVSIVSPQMEALKKKAKQVVARSPSTPGISRWRWRRSKRWHCSRTGVAGRSGADPAMHSAS